MTALGVQIGSSVESGVGSPAPSELAELLGAFNEVTGRLQRTHERLQREVAGLKRELREANEQLSRSKRLAALGEMAAGIAHEVRNPLSSIRLYARMLEQDLADRPGQRAIAGRIGTAVQGLDAVVGDVLNFSRELRPRPERVAASVLFDRALDACAGEAAGVRLLRAVREENAEGAGGPEDRGGGRAVFCDPTLAHTALVNVIRNAYQAMGERPRVGGHELTLSAHAEAGEDGVRGVALCVADTGPGVTDELIDRMFNPFFTTRAAGTGLGLAIVHRIVDAHAGRIAVRNRPGAGGGAVFELFFPFPNCAEDIDGAARDGASEQETGR